MHSPVMPIARFTERVLERLGRSRCLEYIASEISSVDYIIKRFLELDPEPSGHATGQMHFPFACEPSEYWNQGSAIVSSPSLD
jgi:hypothetical protein